MTILIVVLTTESFAVVFALGLCRAAAVGDARMADPIGHLAQDLTREGAALLERERRTA